MKKVVVAGCRDFSDYPTAKAFIDQCIAPWREEQLIFLSGGCSGADLLGERYASENGFEIERYPAQWKKYGRAAGPRRNREMAQAADGVICFWDGQSRGTASMIRYTEQLKKTLWVCYIEKNS